MGLNEQQARAYLALLDVPTATANDLSKTSRVPRAKLYEVLESLNRKGLLDVIPETPQRFRANPVSALYDTRVEELRAEEAELKRNIGELMLQFVGTGIEKTRDPERDFVHIAHGRTHFPILARQFVLEAKSSIVIIGDKLVLPRLRVYEDTLQALARTAQTLSVRVLVPEDAVEQVDGRRVRLDEISERVRRAPWPGGDACVIVRDQTEYLVTRFLPNDLHPSRGSDLVEVGHEREIAALWHKIGVDAWERAAAWTPTRVPR